MSTPRIVLENGNWFLNSLVATNNGENIQRKYKIDYRYAICYSLLNFLHPCRDNENKSNKNISSEELFLMKEGQQALNDLKDILKENKYWKKNEFLEVIPFENGGRKGCVIVDKSDGLYPLVLYAGKDRLKAYSQSLENVISLYENHVYPCLCKAKSIKDWSQTFQQQEIEAIPWERMDDEELN